MTQFARLAQLVEHSHGKAGVEGSSPSPGFPRATPRRSQRGHASSSQSFTS
jgi:hypothetical protein